MLDHHEAPTAIAPQPQVRACARCAETKPESAFHRRGEGRRMSTCGDCRNEVRRIKGSNKGRSKDRYRPRETPEERFRRKLWYEYKLTCEQYEALVHAQSGVCAICNGAPEPGKRLVIDHCHNTGKVRALLCTYCNVVVGAYENHRQAAAEYLAKYGNGNPLLVAQGGTR
ncbi:endonuclease domain-containing protein [Streptomyces umbrinus]|uniref:endonuclease domain-containing protein n=1 Tax=Streptomyces umbrinus TaxID=67370 RepID=UPI003C2B3B6A